MLTRLSVRNLAIVESADVEFGGGLTVITGETGAGKSVLMGALELVLGARADASTVRDGAKEARIEAEFQVEGSRLKVEGAGTIDDFLAEAGLPLCEDGVLIVRRTISATGGGRVHVNNAASTVQTLRALGKPIRSSTISIIGIRRMLLAISSAGQPTTHKPKTNRLPTRTNRLSTPQAIWTSLPYGVRLLSAIPSSSATGLQAALHPIEPAISSQRTTKEISRI